MKSRRIDEQQEDFDRNRFINVAAAEKFDLISKNQSFIKEKGFHHPDDLFEKTLANKGGRRFANPQGQLPHWWFENSTPF